MFAYPDPRTADLRERRIQRIFEIIPGALTWFTLIGMFVFSFWVPLWVAVFIIVFDIYWLYRTVYISIYSIMAFRKMRRYQEVDWMEACFHIAEPQKYFEKSQAEYEKLKKSFRHKKWFSRERKEIKKNALIAGELQREIKNILKNDPEKFLKWQDVYHVVMLPTANEGAEIIEPAIQAVADSSFPSKKFIILLATEERENQRIRF